MSKKGNIQHSVQGVFVFVLLGLFALMSTLMVLLGAQMYRGTVDKTTRNNEDRVLSAYVRSMVRAQDAADAVRVETNGDTQCLALYEDIDGETFVTWIYQYDGQLYEQFTEADYAFDPAGGSPICPANSFAASLEGRLLTVDMTNEKDEPCRVQVALRCAE